MANYYIDYENVHNEGLKGIHKLESSDRLFLFYSSKADTLKIDVVRQLMNCSAEIMFEKIVNGIDNALDFQLITALMCNYQPSEDYYIISRDKGYDAAIEMAGKQSRGNIYRCRDIDGAIKHQVGLGIDESDQEVIADIGTDEDYAVPVAEDIPPYEQENMESFSAMPEDNSMPENPAAEGEPDKEAAAEIATADEEQAADNTESQDDSENQESTDTENPPAEEVAEEERKRRAYQSICTKLLNHIKLNHKIPLTYKQAGVIYEALAESDSKMQFYHKLIQVLGRKRGGALYQKVKITYKSIAGIYKASMTADEGRENAAAEDKSMTAGEADKMAAAADNVQSIRSDFEAAEQQQGNPGEAILRMAELVKDI